MFKYDVIYWAPENEYHSWFHGFMTPKPISLLKSQTGF